MAISWRGIEQQLGVYIYPELIRNMKTVRLESLEELEGKVKNTL